MISRRVTTILSKQQPAVNIFRRSIQISQATIFKSILTGSTLYTQTPNTT